MKRAALHNLGCKVNAYETEAMQQLLEQNGYEIVPFSEKADVYVINTCSVTNIADRKSRQMLHRAKKLNPDSIVVAAGCYVQTSEEQARADAAIDILIGNNKKHELIDMLREFEARRAAVRENDCQERLPRQDMHSAGDSIDIVEAGKESAIIDINDRTTEYESLSIQRTSEHTRAFLKVQDGCNQFCSYCIIPYARGRVRSRSLTDVQEEVRRLAEYGCKEVVLTGIHLDSYGVDTGETLLHLIERVHEVDGIRRIRLGSLEPTIVTEEFARTLAGLPKVCPHFHLSLQSGCDSVLKRMNRRYTCEEYRQGCRILRKYFEHPAITTDVIVGFPGETEEEFEATRAFLQEIAFFEVHIFKYSRRQGTRAAVMANQVPEEVKTARSDCLFADTAKLSRDFMDWYAGKRVEALMEEPIFIEGKRYFTGYTPEYVKVALETEEELTNQMVSGVVRGELGEYVLL